MLGENISSICSRSMGRREKGVKRYEGYYFAQDRNEICSQHLHFRPYTGHLKVWHAKVMRGGEGEGKGGGQKGPKTNIKNSNFCNNIINKPYTAIKGKNHKKKFKKYIMFYFVNKMYFGFK